jgi:hypothetical protein
MNDLATFFTKVCTILRVIKVEMEKVNRYPTDSTIKKFLLKYSLIDEDDNNRISFCTIPRPTSH